jgi:hypothetical protein
VEKCPQVAIGEKEEDTHISVHAVGYENLGKKAKGGSMDVCLEKAAWEGVYAPIKIDYPKHVIDLPRYRELFDRINELNKKREVTNKLADKSDVVWRYSHTGSGEGLLIFWKRLGIPLTSRAFLY